MQNTTIRCRVKINKVFFPKNEEDFTNGGWCALSCEILNLFEGEIQQNHRYINQKQYINVSGYYFGVLDLSVEYNLNASYFYDEKYGHKYIINTMQKAISLIDPFEQRQFLEMILTESQVNLLYTSLENPFEVIKQGDEETLLKIRGLGDKTVKKIINTYQGNEGNQVLYALVRGFGGTERLAKKLLETYKCDIDKIVDIINNNPYILIDDVDGIGWQKADKIAIDKGLPLDSVERIKAFIIYYLKDMAQKQGHSWITPEDLLEYTLSDLNINSSDKFISALYELQEEQQIDWVEDKSKIYLSNIHHLENQIAEELLRLINTDVKLETTDYINKLKLVEQRQGWEFTDEQLKAIKTVLHNQITIITGYGGTGKSSVVAGVLQLLNDHSYAQTALSGRAASRLSEITHQEGYTIHRLIGLLPKSNLPTYNPSNPLNEDIIILDEVSMVGANLFLKLLQAIKTGAKLIMIGDDGQLESIGLCNVFRDMLDSGIIPVCQLTQIHRQAAKSGIITESIKVRKHTQLCPMGWVGEEHRGELQDFKLNVYMDKALSQNKIIEEFTKILSLGVKGSDIQVVVPQRERGEISTFVLNNIIQDIVNPHTNQKEIQRCFKNKNFVLRTGDKVIATINNYKIQRYCTEEEVPVYNGNIGYITKIDSDGGLVVNFDLWGELYIPHNEISMIELAYALTCHKLQGSEAPYVIVGIDYSAITLLTKEWLYTAITRAKKSCVVCAETKALHYCISNSKVPHKRTFLKDFLIQKEKERKYENN